MEPRHDGGTTLPVPRTSSACPQCGSTRVTTSYVDHEFRYGSAESAVELTAHLPAHRCAACDFEFLDDEAERVKHQAVCDHFGVLSPIDIQRIRRRYRMTRAAFSRVTGLGEATLGRWESGLLIQNRANDRYLRLLDRPEIMQVLQGFHTARRAPTSTTQLCTNRFRMLHISHAIQQEQESFQLRLDR